MPTNFIFILADDLGYADLGCYGGRAPISPNIDRMAAEGVRFTRGYANSAVCSPTRFALATGRYQYRIRGAAEEPIGSTMRGDKVIGLPPDHPTLASCLAEAGYRTALIGKWHLGFPPTFGPLRSGYHEHFGPCRAVSTISPTRTASERTTCSRTAARSIATAISPIC
jgi:arylsulfatase A-like enzyme